MSPRAGAKRIRCVVAAPQAHLLRAVLAAFRLGVPAGEAVRVEPYALPRRAWRRAHSSWTGRSSTGAEMGAVGRAPPPRHRPCVKDRLLSTLMDPSILD